MDRLLELILGTPWWLVFALAVWGLCWATYRDLYKHEASRKRWVGYLTQNTWPKRYRRLLGSVLDWIDARLTPEIRDGARNLRPEEARSAWSHGMLSFSLLCAQPYPVLSVVVYWAATGDAGRIGSLVLLEAGVPAWQS